MWLCFDVEALCFLESVAARAAMLLDGRVQRYTSVVAHFGSALALPSLSHLWCVARHVLCSLAHWFSRAHERFVVVRGARLEGAEQQSALAANAERVDRRIYAVAHFPLSSNVSVAARGQIRFA